MEGPAMTTKELAITILGLAGTYCLPWPGEAEHGMRVEAHPGASRKVCVTECGNRRVPSAPRPDETVAAASAGPAAAAALEFAAAPRRVHLPAAR
jgi:hypothetical protein